MLTYYVNSPQSNDMDLPPVSVMRESVPKGCSVDMVLDVLVEPHRRQLLVILEQTATPEQISTLARTLGAFSDKSTDEDIQQIVIRLYHLHIPKMEEAALVSYTEEQDSVDLTEFGQLMAEALSQDL